MKNIIILIVVFTGIISSVFAETIKPDSEMLKNADLKVLYSKAAEKALELRSVAYILIAFFVFLALATVYIKMMVSGVFEFYPVIIRSIFGLILLAGYTQVINLPLAVVDGLSNAISEDDLVVRMYERIILNNKYARANANQGEIPVCEEYKVDPPSDKILSVWSDLKWSIGALTGWFARKANGVIYFLSTIIISVGMTVMGIIRHLILAFLITIGVLLIPFIVWPQVSRITRGWFMALMSVASWVIVWKVLLLLGTTFLPSLKATSGYKEIIASVCYNYAFGVLLIATPAIIQGLVSASGLGNVLSIAGGAAVAKISDMAGKWYTGQGSVIGATRVGTRAAMGKVPGVRQVLSFYDKHVHGKETPLQKHSNNP